MKESLYFAPKDLKEAVKLLGNYKERAVILAGGTDLVPRINTYHLRPEVLVYIGKAGLDYIKEEKGKFVIGAATPMAKIAGSKLLARKAGALVEAAAQAGTQAVRTAATIGGNLANASPAADLATPLLAMDAELSLVGPKKKRVVPLKDFFTGPGKTVLQAGEMIAEITVPVPKGKTVFVKLGRRKALTLSVVNAAVRLEMKGKKCQEARIALGSVAPLPLRCAKAEGMLQGKGMDSKLIAHCAAEAIAASQPDRRSPGVRLVPEAGRDRARSPGPGRSRRPPGEGRRERLMKYALSFDLNGLPVDVLVKPTDTLLDVLREKLGVMSPKRGCDTGECGTCTVLLDGEPIRSCLTIALTAAGRKVETVEGLMQKWKTASPAGSFPGALRRPVRVLHAGDADVRQSA